MIDRNWDEWYHELCETVAKNSKCLSRHIGAIMVRDKAVISQGYNGPPRGVPHCDIRHQFDKDLMDEYIRVNASDEDITEITATTEVGTCPRYILGYKSGEGLDLCVAGHSERNVLINASRMGIATKGAKLYMNCGIPCTPCLVEIINAGIEEIIVTKYEFYDRSAEYLLLNNSNNLKYRIFDHLKGE
jgi:dCMP deaminase